MQVNLTISNGDLRDGKHSSISAISFIPQLIKAGY
jgi:hypothetical protein